MNQPNLPSPVQQPSPQSEPNASQPHQSAPSQMPSSAPISFESVISIANVIAAITTAISPTQLNQHLKSFAPKDVREVILSGLLSEGQDPLTVLNIQANTLGILYILSARLNTAGAPIIPLEYVLEFCRTFVPEQARYAPERVTLLASGIPVLAEAAGNLRLAIEPLFHLLSRFTPSPSHLTTIHPIFVKTCVTTRHFAAALPVLDHPITIVDTSISDLTYNDTLVYHYAGGMVYAALKRWPESQEFFEICACNPGSAAAAIQMEALKKLILVQLIHEGKTSPPPKYIHPSLPRLLKGTPYSSFVNAYPEHRAQLRTIIEAEQQVFTTEKTLGLVIQALDRAPRWSIKKLTATYLTLHLSAIAQAVSIENESEVRALILDMIDASEIAAQISEDGTVSFFDPPVKFEMADVDRALAQALDQGSLLSNLEREMGRNKEYLAKAVKGKEEAAWGGGMDDDVGDRMGPGWVEDIGMS